MSDRLSHKRPASARQTPSYPTRDEFERGRREFLARLGGLLGLSALAGFVGGCGDRPVGAGGDEPPPDPGPGGVADAMPPPIDEPDAGMGGVADAMPPPLDSSGVPDAMPTVIDDAGRGDREPVVSADLGGPAGVAPAPEAGVDGGSPSR